MSNDRKGRNMPAGKGLGRRQFVKCSLATAAVAVPAAALVGEADAEEKRVVVQAAGKTASKFAPRGRARIIEGKADVLFLGEIITMDMNKPRAKAMTVKNGLIQYVGGEDVARALCDANTRVIDHRGHFLYPGFLEAHAHGMQAGQRALGQANLMPGTTYEEYRAIMEKYVRANPDKSLYVGAGWAWVGKNPDKSLLDGLPTDKPVVMINADCHSMLLNSKALDFFGFTAEACAKFGASLVRMGKDGKPTGYISEEAVLHVNEKLIPGLEEMKSYLLWWQDFAFELGYTGTCDAGTNLPGPRADEAYAALVEEGRFRLRTYAYHYIHEANPDIPGEIAKAAARRYDSEYFRTVGIKVFNDGVIEGHTGWLLKAYDDKPGDFGVKRFCNHEQMVGIITAASRAGMSVHAHTIGDGASRFQLDAIEASQKATGNMDQRNCLAHLQLVRPEDIQRMADLNVVPIVPPLWTPKDDSFAQEVSYTGQERANHSFPIKSFFDAGAVAVFHTDFPVSPIVGIPMTIYSALTRTFPKYGKQGVRNAAEATTRYQALLAMTKNVAWLWHEEQRMGSLEIGKLANISVWDTDFLAADLEQIPHARSVATYVDGQEVYRRKG